MSESVRALAVIGSLRKGSYNRMLYENARGLVPEGMTIEAADISAIPLYDDDVRVASGFPEPVRKLREQIAAAGALLFISPEYNFSIPGVLKNAIDWASRPPDQPLRAKPAGIMGASPSRIGTARMQFHLRQVLLALDVHTLNRPEVLISRAAERFDASGRLTDAKSIEVVRAHLEALLAWARRMRP